MTWKICEIWTAMNRKATPPTTHVAERHAWMNWTKIERASAAAAFSGKEMIQHALYAEERHAVVGHGVGSS